MRGRDRHQNLLGRISKVGIANCLISIPQIPSLYEFFYSFLSWEELYEFQVHLIGNKESLEDQGQSHDTILGLIPSFATYQASLHLSFLFCSLGI